MAETEQASQPGQDAPQPGLRDRIAAWRAGLGRPAVGFVAQPEPRTIGMVARGRQLLAGNFLLAGVLVEAPGLSLWDVPAPEPGFTAAAQGFGWLDDLAAVADPQARTRAQDWLFDWIDRYGTGQGPGWVPDLTGRRLVRWINHTALLLQGRDRAEADRYYTALTRQARYLARRWSAAAPGLPRFEALAGLTRAALSLDGLSPLVDPAVAALARECGQEIDAQGGIPTRNPEELLEVLTLLTGAAQALAEAGQSAPTALHDAIARIAPTLRALRHADGGLARFHGGGRGMEGRLDHALAESGVRALAASGPAMGYLRLSGGRTSIIIDAADPPGGGAAGGAHASTLAFELTSGRRPVVVSCGSGLPFGVDWALAGRATASHSTLAIDGFSSSRMGPGRGRARLALEDRAHVIHLRQTAGNGGHAVVLGHDGWSQTHGLTHVRALELSNDGRRLAGEDTLGAATTTERKRFDTVMEQMRLAGVPFAVRFHLHPDVDAALDMGGTAVSLALKSGEIWVFRHDGAGRLSLEPSVYLEKGRLAPRATKQIILSGRVLDYAAQVGWTLAKAQDTPLAIRDLDRDDPVI
ncbi:heparinase II/III family protein [Ruixingdingia sedimenti]|uniref:Heparinase II/III family protein n=1 Tax=Ruixingdingia sedimenti TaxID=3073604 RepID=A0ABU1F6T0_9RHOB|nr:heparinase II/III family protein [Xinfangfangia sp. LG-4]MDR5652586.1 heparinase II/III family protein [Xinfangfangia sp. LG-4]